MKSYWIGLIGKNGSGKSTVGQYLISKNFKFLSLSQVLRQYATDHHLAQDRNTLIQTANELKKQHGLSYFAQVCVKKANENPSPYVVFDSIRHVQEIEYLKLFQVEFWAIEAPIELRYKRIQQRQGETDQVSFEEFQEQERIESTGESMGQQLDAALKCCDYSIHNTGSRKDLIDKIDQKLNRNHASTSIG